MAEINSGSWSTPISSIAKDTANYGDRWRLYGRGAQWLDATIKPVLPIAYDGWGAWPKYDATLAGGGTKRVWQSAVGDPAPKDEPARWTTVAATGRTWPITIPWGANWRQPSGTDRGILIELGGGIGYEILNLRQPWGFEEFILGFTTGGQYRSGDLVCDQFCVRTPTNHGTYRGRGMGLVPKAYGLLTGDDLLAKDIKHALAVVGFNLETGPQATFRAPATNVEHPAENNTFTGYHPNAPDSRLIPQGTRLYLNMTATAISAWAKRYDTNPTLKSTALKIVRCLKYYGIIVGAESGHGDPLIEATGILGTDGVKFQQAGLTSSIVAATLLDGIDHTKWKVVVAA